MVTIRLGVLHSIQKMSTNIVLCYYICLLVEFMCMVYRQSLVFGHMYEIRKGTHDRGKSLCEFIEKQHIFKSP